MTLFWLPLSVTAIVLLGALVEGGPSMMLALGTLCILEVSLSFDNAVINALWLAKMSTFWQKMFLTVGILIAVFGMRLLFPLLVVALAGHTSIQHALSLAIHEPIQYSRTLGTAQHAIRTFGAVFLGMIFLDFITEEREVQWLPIEGPLAKLGALDILSVAVMLIVLAAAAADTLFAGVLGLVTYLIVNMISGYFEAHGQSSTGTVVKGSIGAFLYLELMDASFSFDGVMAAFAISDKVFVIALGLGIGALFIRTLTVLLVRKGVLSELVYLEHGAHYAIGALSALLFVSLYVEVPEAVSSLTSVLLIGAALASSVVNHRKTAIVPA